MLIAGLQMSIYEHDTGIALALERYREICRDHATAHTAFGAEDRDNLPQRLGRGRRGGAGGRSGRRRATGGGRGGGRGGTHRVDEVIAGEGLDEIAPSAH